MNTSSFERIILITGASRGIGRAITKACAPFFDKMLLVCQKSEAELLSLINELEKDYPVTCIPFIGDIGNPDFVSAVFRNVTQIDAVINNAGISHIGLLSDMSLEEWHSVINTNLNFIPAALQFLIW